MIAYGQQFKNMKTRDQSAAKGWSSNWASAQLSSFVYNIH